MTKEQSAWKAELKTELEIALGASDVENVYVRRKALAAVLPSIETFVKAAEQRGFSAAASKNNETVRRWRRKLGAVRELCWTGGEGPDSVAEMKSQILRILDGD